MQHAVGYLPNRIITVINPVMQISSGAAIPIFIIGLIFSLEPLQTLGILLFAVVVVFQLITLPSEFNASRRAVAMLKSTGIVQTRRRSRECAVYWWRQDLPMWRRWPERFCSFFV